MMVVLKIPIIKNLSSSRTTTTRITVEVTKLNNAEAIKATVVAIRTNVEDTKATTTTMDTRTTDPKVVNTRSRTTTTNRNLYLRSKLTRLMKTLKNLNNNRNLYQSLSIKRTTTRLSNINLSRNKLLRRRLLLKINKKRKLKRIKPKRFSA